MGTRREPASADLGQSRRTRYAGLAPCVAWRRIVVMDTYVLWRIASLPLDGVAMGGIPGVRRRPALPGDLGFY